MAKRITQLSELTTAAQDDYIVIVDTSTGQTKKITVKNLTGLPDVGWTATGESWSFFSYSSTTQLGVFTVPTDATIKYSAGMWIRFSQATGGTKYGEIISVTSTTLTVFLSTFTLNNETVTSPVYSSAKQPVGLPASANAWMPWVPTFTNMSGGTLVSATYKRTGKRIDFKFKYILAGAGISGNVSFTPPSTISSGYSSDFPLGHAGFIDLATYHYTGNIQFNTTTSLLIRCFHVSGSNVGATYSVNATTPFSWGTGDYMMVQGSYEEA